MVIYEVKNFCIMLPNVFTCFVLYIVASKLYGVNATIIIFVFVLYFFVLFYC